MRGENDDSSMQFSLLDFVFPRRSLAGEEGEWVTALERRNIAHAYSIEASYSLRERGIVHLDLLASAAAYDASPLLRKAIWSVKYGRVRGAQAVLTDLLDVVARKRHRTRSRMVLCPVPLHWSRKFSRGFNQSLMLAESAAVKHGLEVRELLRRTRPTGHQAHRDRRERLAALRGVFSLCDDVYIPQHVALIDDIATTGATLDACACALKEAGAQWVEAWVVARG